MTNEEIIEILESYKSFEDNRTEDLLHHGYDNTKASRKRKETLDEAIKALSVPERKWIPVSERLPEDSQRVNITIQNDYTVYVTTATWDGMRGHFYNLGRTLYDVVAWRELPEPYKEGGNE